MSQVLTEEIAKKALQNFFLQKPFVLFGTGTSCAVDTCFGMEALRKHLLLDIPKNHLNPVQSKQWDSVIDKLNSNHDLESAMNDVQDENLTKIIIESTATFVATLDKDYGVKILMGKRFWPALSFFKRLVEGLPETDRVLHVATTNYDLLAEYAFEKEGIPYITGFYGGICRRMDWKQAGRGMTYFERTLIRKTYKDIPRLIKHIRLYKVHGSLNAFGLGSVIVENNAWIFECPDELERIMITPGTAKYKRLHDYRPELLGEYDQAIEKHSAFLFIGFGFNDNQLTNNAIKHKLEEQECPGLIITRDSNPRIEAFLKKCKNLWLVCKHPGGGNNGSYIFNSRYSDGLVIKEKHLWDLDIFTKEILGG